MHYSRGALTYDNQLTGKRIQKIEVDKAEHLHCSVGPFTAYKLSAGKYNR